jgi:signal peptidase I
MGDNRDISMDSRHWGTISGNLITGKALMIYWSLDPRFSLLNSIRFKRLFQIIK